MAVDIMRAVTALLSTCSRRVSRAARKIRGSHHLSLLTPPRPLFSRHRGGLPFRKKIGEEFDDIDEEEEEEEEVWRRGIIMGEKCQPLEFSGAIHYDSNGRQLAEPPVAMPRSPLRSPLPAFIVMGDGKEWK